MQDKEIDQIFRSGFNDFEVEPSAKVWGGIASGLDRRKRSLKMYLGIAASLLLLLSAGLYFVSHVKDNTKKPVQLANVKNNRPAKSIITPVIASPKTEQVQKVAQPQLEKTIAFNTALKSRKQKTKTVKVLPVRDIEIIEPAQQLAQVVQPAQDIKFVVPDREIPLNEKIEIPEDASFKANILAAQPPVTKAIAATPVKKHRIRNLGDLINVVVSKVDKRKDKLIEFSSTNDEDDSVVSGLNLGFIKIKKQDK
ncbi:hypothetical protein [Mucilaginibacter aquariorum]|uniref:Uncharacterized protein n=1 Tax=Mucilaginibacter aquariorum TaxID=2967225 RepID=A0ABT1T852_9SPHI|nr:hypothetical protein [Mucilaginibacter aquariorum]MCQ6960777.1 hypothetical protein [Mucilaginibacter aquariorum]